MYCTILFSTVYFLCWGLVLICLKNLSWDLLYSLNRRVCLSNQPDLVLHKQLKRESRGVVMLFLFSNIVFTVVPYTLPCQTALPEGSPLSMHRVSCPSITMDPQVCPPPPSSNQSVRSSFDKSPGSTFKPGHSRSNSTGSIKHSKQVIRHSYTIYRNILSLIPNVNVLLPFDFFWNTSIFFFQFRFI